MICYSEVNELPHMNAVPFPSGLMEPHNQIDAIRNIIIMFNFKTLPLLRKIKMKLIMNFHNHKIKLYGWVNNLFLISPTDRETLQTVFNKSGYDGDYEDVIFVGCNFVGEPLTTYI